MKILTITNCPLDPTLGSGKTVLRYSEGLRLLEHTVKVLQPSDYELAQTLGRGKRLRQSLGAWQRISAELKKDKYDLVEFFGAEHWLAVAKLATFENRPLLVAHTNGLELLHYERERSYLPPKKTFAGRLRQQMYSAVFEPLMRLSFSGTDRFVSLCEADRDFVVEAKLYAREQTEVVGPGLDDEFLQMPEPQADNRKDCVIYVGSWTERKGLDEFVKAMSQVLTNNPNVTLLIYGSHASPSTVLESFPQEVQARISVEDSVANSDLSQALSHSKVFFFPTQYEGYGMALAEAMSCGCACVTTKTGLGAELNDGEDALLCDFKDTGKMVQAIESLLKDEALRSKIALAGWQRTRSMDWPSNVKKLETTYLRWLGENYSP